MNIIQKINSINEVQDAIKEALEANVFFARHKVPVIIENAAQIEYLIKNALGKLGAVCVVQTPTFEFIGKADDGHPIWEMTEASVVISEIPTTNRSRAGSATALDCALNAAEALNEAFGSAMVLENINQTENNGVVSVFVSFKTFARFCYAREDLPPTESGSNS